MTEPAAHTACLQPKRPDLTHRKPGLQFKVIFRKFENWFEKKPGCISAWTSTRFDTEEKSPVSIWNWNKTGYQWFCGWGSVVDQNIILLAKRQTSKCILKYAHRGKPHASACCWDHDWRNSFNNMKSLDTKLKRPLTSWRASREKKKSKKA